MKAIPGVFLRSIFILILFIPILSSGTPLKRDIKKVNNLFIFDFFINFELSQKNGNLSTLVDYLPDANNKTYKRITARSNLGGYAEESDFQYNDKGNLEILTYQVKDKIYTYEFIYEKNRLASVLIAGKKKITFKYDVLDRLLSITRETPDGTIELNFVMVEGQNKANIKLSVIRNGQRNSSQGNYYIAWNDIYKMDAFYFDVYSGKNLKYTTNGELISFTFSNVMRDDNLASWEYTYDNKGNWIEKKHEETFYRRTIIPATLL